MKSNITKYYLFSIFVRLTFYSPVFVLLLTNKGLSLTEILTVQSLHSLGAMLFEVPCGAFADKYNKKISLIIGSFIWGLTLLFYGLSENFLAFGFWAFVGGIGQAFMSGADSVLLHESLQDLGQDTEYKKIEGKSRGFYTIIKIFATALSGFIAKISIPLTLYLSAISVFISTFVSTTFKTPKVDIDFNKPSILKTITSGFQKIFRVQELLWLTIFLSFTNGIIWAATSLTQPYLNMVDFPLEYFGLLFAGFGVITALISFNIHKFKKLNGNGFLLVILILCAISSFTLGLIPGIMTFLLWSIIESTTVITPFLVTSRTLEISSKSEATTILSFQNVFLRLVNIIISPIIGFLATNLGVLETFKIIGLMFVVIFVFLLVGYLTKRKRVESKEY